MTSVMSPTHCLRPGVDNIWLPIDCRSVALLRDALDREGGRHVAIDYPLILTAHTVVRRAIPPPAPVGLARSSDRHLVLRLSGFGADSRLSGFGADSGPLTVKKTLTSIQELHGLGYPILLDYVGGLVGLGALAFGIVSGIAHGIGERDRFDARSWHKPPKRPTKERRFGRTVYFRYRDWTSRSASRILRPSPARPGGADWSPAAIAIVCPRGLTSMLSNHRSHIARQKIDAIDSLFAVPDARRH